MLVRVERLPEIPGDNDANLAKALSDEIRKHILVRTQVEVQKPGALPRSFAKTKRVQDDRSED
jgi:phenylacetate-CoA ligase